jgi:shikimate dehydrogenase
MRNRSILVGLVGAGIQRSLTPRLHEKEGDELGMRYMYKLVDLDVLGLSVAALPEILRAAELLGFAGLNVTFPCKQAVIGELDELSPDARAIGAVNTVVFKNGRRFGYNTDWTGFCESFRRTFPDVARNNVVQFGAGGAGAAVAYALLTLGVGNVVLIDTNRRRAGNLAETLCGRFGSGRAVASEDMAVAISSADGLINTTPVGMEKFQGMVLPENLLSHHLWVADIVYFPLDTQLLRVAKLHGCRTMSGAGMVVFQAVAAFRLFTDLEPNAERVLRHFDQLTAIQNV